MNNEPKAVAPSIEGAALNHAYAEGRADEREALAQICDEEAARIRSVDCTDGHYYWMAQALSAVADTFRGTDQPADMETIREKNAARQRPALAAQEWQMLTEGEMRAVHDATGRGYMSVRTIAFADALVAAFVAKNAGRPAAQEPATPANRWRPNGEPDPHAGKYDGERAALCMGNLTDDELANAAFLNYDRRPTPQQIIAGTHHLPIAYMTAVKERIRWLSRKLEAVASASQKGEGSTPGADGLRSTKGATPTERRQQIEAILQEAAQNDELLRIALASRCRRGLDCERGDFDPPNRCAKCDRSLRYE